MEYKLDAANIEKISWSNETLRVFFLNGQIVAYKGVPEGIAEGMAGAKSAGSYMWRHISNQYSRVVEKESDLKSQNRKLEHHKDITVGLWATDRPDLIPVEIKELFFQITYDEVGD